MVNLRKLHYFCDLSVIFVYIFLNWFVPKMALGDINLSVKITKFCSSNVTPLRAKFSISYSVLKQKNIMFLLKLYYDKLFTDFKLKLKFHMSVHRYALWNRIVFK